MRIGIMTGGGDCPGLNAVIRAIVRKGDAVYGDEFIGFLDSWDGVMAQRFIELPASAVRGLLPRGERFSAPDVEALTIRRMEFSKYRNALVNNVLMP